MSEPLLPADFHEREDALELLAAALGQAIASPKDELFGELLDEVHPLLEAGLEEIARALVQAAIYRSLKGGPLDKDDLLPDNFDDGNWPALLREGISTLAENSWLLASALGAGADVSNHLGDFALAADLHRVAANRWAELGDAEAEAFELLRLGAAEHHMGNYESALEVGSLAAERFREAKNVRGEVLTSLNLEQTRAAMRDHEGALAELANAQHLAAKVRDGHLSASIALALGINDARDGKYREARVAFRHAYESAMRRGEISQAAAAARNLAAVHDDLALPRRASEWWRKAIALALEINDWRSAQDWQHQFGLRLAEREEFEQGALQLDLAVTLNNQHKDDHQAARVQSDMVAIWLNWAIAEKTGDQESIELVTKAEELAVPTWRRLEELADFTWATTVAHNLRAIWTLGRREEYGADMIVRAVERHSTDNPKYAGELLHDAALLLLGADREDRSGAIMWLTQSSFLRHEDTTSRALDLASEAAYVATYDKPTALAVYDAALEGLEESNPTAFGNILNDAAILASDLGRFDVAEEQLSDVTRIARTTRNRVMLAMATANLGELAQRKGDGKRARDLFSRAAELELRIGNTEGASMMQSAIANSFIHDGLYKGAAKPSESAQGLAKQSQSPNATARALSTQASLRFAEGRFEDAFSIWARCAELAADPKDDEYKSFALEALAHVGNWPRFKTTFIAWAKEAQKHGSQASFVKNLHLSALAWIDQNRAAPAGTVLAWAVLLGFQGVLESTQGPSARTLPQADAQYKLLSIADPLGIAYALFVVMGLPTRQVATIRRAYERAIRTAAGENATQIIELVDDFLSREPEA